MATLTFERPNFQVIVPSFSKIPAVRAGLFFSALGNQCMLSLALTQAFVAVSLRSTKYAKNVDVDPGPKTMSDNGLLLEISTKNDHQN